MNKRAQIAGIAFVSGVMGVSAAWVSYILAVALAQPVAEYMTFGPALVEKVRRGDILEVPATYRKNVDCAGVVLVDLDDSSTDGGKVIHERKLGNRPLGEWSITRRYEIPRDAQLGPASLQEILVYDCVWRDSITRSPRVMFEIVE